MLNLLFSTVALSEAVVDGLISALGNTWYLLLFNFFGIVAICVKVCEYQLKTRDRIIIFATLGSCCWFTYFVLRGDFTSAISNFSLIVQGIIFYQRDKHKWANSIVWLFVFIIAQGVFGVITFKTAFDVFPIFGGTLCTIAYFVLNEKKYRLIVLFATLLWFLNSVTKGYELAMINDTCCLISVIVGIIRYNLIEKKQRQNKIK